tara:strand:- start:80 stop:580 length:501 start_codon:yes stop_codon:yes gene_type:complete
LGVDTGFHELMLRRAEILKPAARTATKREQTKSPRKEKSKSPKKKHGAQFKLKTNFDLQVINETGDSEADLDAFSHIDLNKWKSRDSRDRTLGSFHLPPGAGKRDVLLSPDMRGKRADASLLSLTLEPTHHQEQLTRASERLQGPAKLHLLDKATHRKIIKRPTKP